MAVIPSYAILDPDGNFIAGEKPDMKQDPASTTKVWTLVTLDQLAKDGKISRDFIQKHDRLVTLMMRDSNNEAANELASLAGKEMGGDKSSFVAEMNRLAASRGLNATHFVTVDGMNNPDHYSTARDMARMMHVFRTEHGEQLHYSSKITTADVIGTEGIDYFKTGTAVGNHGSSGKSSGVGIKDGYSFSVAGADGSAARKALVSAIARNIPTHAGWREEQQREGGFSGASEEEDRSRPRGSQPEPNVQENIQNDFATFLFMLISALMGGLSPREEPAQGQTVPASESLTAGRTPPMTDASKRPSL